MIVSPSPKQSPMSRTQPKGFFSTQHYSAAHSPMRGSMKRRGDGKGEASFKIINKGKMPSKAPIRMTRLEFLMQRPNYKPQREKSVLLPVNERNNSPMTLEDKEFINDKDLIYSLRKNFDKNGILLKGPLPNYQPIMNQSPPSFYETDLERLKKRFETPVKQRAAFKERYSFLSDIKPHTLNTNVKDQGYLTTQTTDGNSFFNSNSSVYKKVMMRRNSRQSTLAPTNIDIEYSGNSCNIQHLIHKRVGQTGSPNKSQLNFELNLRTYKNSQSFVAQRPFIYPKRDFSVKEQFDDTRNLMMSTIKNYTDEFNDTYKEKNYNKLRHLVDRQGTLYTTMWECSLRDDTGKSQSPARGKTAAFNSKGRNILKKLHV